MLKATFFVGNQIYKNNRIFDEKSFLNRDDALKCYIQLKKKLEKININLSTQDINNEEKSLFVLYFDFLPKEIKNNLDMYEPKYPKMNFVITLIINSLIIYFLYSFLS